MAKKKAPKKRSPRAEKPDVEDVPDTDVSIEDPLDRIEPLVIEASDGSRTYVFDVTICVPTRKASGQPSALTAQVASSVIRDVAEGMPPAAACVLAGVTERAYYLWRSRALSEDEDPAYFRFFQCLQQAKAIAIREALGVVRLAEREKTDGRLALERLKVMAGRAFNPEHQAPEAFDEPGDAVKRASRPQLPDPGELHRVARESLLEEIGRGSPEEPEVEATGEDADGGDQ